MKKGLKVVAWAMGIAFFGAALASWLVYDAENNVDDDAGNDGGDEDDLEEKGGEK